VAVSTTQASRTEKPIDPASLSKGDLFDVMPPGDWQGRFTEADDAHGQKKVTIDIVALGAGKPAFSPAIITGSPGQKLHVTVSQTNDLSSQYEHNFSIDALGISEDIPKGPSHSVTVTVTLPDSGSLGFYCSYHVVPEHHAGLFLVTH
jgi:plastocyanin